ncbi:MAG TPA: helix-hairpin-helix domain-containing protein [Chitinophagaceae bacterium]|nr:helix-hairpin-helix domain-containing protein [Chitinophagaceae bacterium]
MKWNEFARDYLTFTRKERIGILVIVGVIVFTLFLPDVLKETSDNNPTQIDTAWLAAVKKLEIKKPDSLDDHFQKKNDDEDAFAYQYDRKKINYDEPNISKGELFYFDPNTISSADWKRLGVRDKTIQTITNFLSKGGHFYKPGDLQKIYGLHKDDYERLERYIRIQTRTSPRNEQFVLSKPNDEAHSAKTFAPQYSSIDINTADTSAFISLPGIGSKLALRIVTFREKLGGFYSIDQIGETYALADTTFQKIKQYLKLDNPSVKKINVNTATIDEMKAHPYIKHGLANPIVAYRNEHGSFSQVEDIKKVMAVTDEIYKKIAPYLTID